MSTDDNLNDKFTIYSQLREHIDKEFGRKIENRFVTTKLKIAELERALENEKNWRKQTLNAAYAVLAVLGIGSGVAFWQGIKSVSSDVAIAKAKEAAEVATISGREVESILRGLKARPNTVVKSVAEVLSDPKSELTEAVLSDLSSRDQFKSDIATSIVENRDFESEQIASAVANLLFTDPTLKKTLAALVVDQASTEDGVTLVRLLAESISPNTRLKQTLAASISKDSDFQGEVAVKTAENMIGENKVISKMAESIPNLLKSSPELSSDLIESLTTALMKNGKIEKNLRTELVKILEKDEERFLPSLSSSLSTKLEDSDKLKEILRPALVADISDSGSFRIDLARDIGNNLITDGEFKQKVANFTSGKAFISGGIFQARLDHCEIPNPYTNGCSCPPQFHPKIVARSELFSFSGMFGSPVFLEISQCISSEAISQ